MFAAGRAVKWSGPRSMALSRNGAQPAPRPLDGPFPGVLNIKWERISAEASECRPPRLAAWSRWVDGLARKP